MFYLVPIILKLITVECANLRFDSSTGYYSSTMGSVYSPYPKGVSYESDVATFPASYPSYGSGYSTTSRYPYGGGYTTSAYDTYGTGYSTGGYNSGYGAGGGLYGSNTGYNSYNTYNTPRYANAYGSSGSMGGLGYSSYEAPFMKGYGGMGGFGTCSNRDPQVGIWMEELMGFWYGVEVVQHLGPGARTQFDTACIVLHLSEPKDRPSTENVGYHAQHLNAKFRQDFRHLRLLWDEAGLTSEYAIYFRNDSAGHWNVMGSQNGTLTTYPTYQQFGGSIQVLKAVNDHLVLNFCQEQTPTRSAQLYTVLFSRRAGYMDPREVDFVHRMLQNKQLSIASRRMVCGNNSASKMFESAVFSIIICILAYVVGAS